MISEYVPIISIQDIRVVILEKSGVFLNVDKLLNINIATVSSVKLNRNILISSKEWYFASLLCKRSTALKNISIN